MKYICPLVTVSNIQRAREFYETILNQNVKYDFGENVTFEGDFSIHLKKHFSKLIDNKPIVEGSHSFELYFEHDELDRLFEKLKREKIEFVHELREQPWRQKVMRIYDPDRNVIEIGESMEHVAYRLSIEGLPEDEISKITYLPFEEVQKAIRAYSA